MEEYGTVRAVYGTLTVDRGTENSSRLEEKLARIRKDPTGAQDFLICDAKDGDMGGGIPMPGPRRDAEGRPTGAFKTRRHYLDQIKALLRQDIVDLMLLSVGNLELLVREGVFRESRVAWASSRLAGRRHPEGRRPPRIAPRNSL